MKKFNWFVILGICFLLTAFAIYSIHFLIFRDSYFIFKYLIAQLGFLPLNVFLVTIVLNQLISRREKRARMQKLNMIIGAFFSDIGTELIGYLLVFDHDLCNYQKNLIPDNSWTASNFIQAKSNIKKINCHVLSQQSSLKDLQQYLTSKRQQLLSFLENPNLLEHEHFSELIWAVFHLQDELLIRTEIDNISPEEAEHLSTDINRAYFLLILQWIDYMQHLKESYPYLYSLAIRVNPFLVSQKNDTVNTNL